MNQQTKKAQINEAMRKRVAARDRKRAQRERERAGILKVELTHDEIQILLRAMLSIMPPNYCLEYSVKELNTLALKLGNLPVKTRVKK